MKVCGVAVLLTCSWVRWSEGIVPGRAHLGWLPGETDDSKAACVRGEENRLRAAQARGDRVKDGVVTGMSGQLKGVETRYRCYPDTVDPRTK
jgi:hypothetical protein